MEGNPYRGEVSLVMNGRTHRLRLTLGTLAELEAALEADSLIELVQRFENATFSSRDIIALLIAGLRGGGWQGDPEELQNADIKGGPQTAAQVAALLLHRAFGVQNPASP